MTTQQFKDNTAFEDEDVFPGDPNPLPDDDDVTAQADDEIKADDFDDGMSGAPADDTHATPEPTPVADKDDRAPGEEPAATTAMPTDYNPSPALLTIAQQLGISEQEARLFKSDEALQQTLFHVHRAQTDSARKAQPPADATVAQDEVDPFKVELDPDEYDPAYIKAMEKIGEATKQQFGKINAALEQVREMQLRSVREVERRSAEEFEERFDNLIAKAESLKNELGEGRGVDLDRNSQQYKNRVSILNMMGVLSAGYRAAKLPIPSEAELFDRAVRSEFGATSRGDARKEIAAKIERRSNMISNRPSASTRSVPRDPQADAKAFVKDFLAKAGIEA